MLVCSVRLKAVGATGNGDFEMAFTSTLATVDASKVLPTAVLFVRAVKRNLTHCSIGRLV